MENNLKKIIKNAKKIVFFGGAGVSIASGIPDFRSKTGLYQIKSEYGASYEEMLSHTYFIEHTNIFYDFYKKKMIYLDALPNDAHKALAKLEQSGKDITIITQNIDGLHQKAGSKKVYELHGSIHRNYCVSCHKFYDAYDIMKMKGTPYCSCGNLIKPDVVLYEESLDNNTIKKSVQAIMNADVMIVAGTSLNVYPAAGLIQYFNGNKLIIINKEITNQDSYADIVIHDDLCKILKEAID